MKPLLASLLVVATAAVIGAYALTENRSIANSGRLLAEAGSSLFTAVSSTTNTTSGILKTVVEPVTTVVTEPVSSVVNQTVPIVTNVTVNAVADTASSTKPLKVEGGVLPQPAIVQPKDAAPRILKDSTSAPASTNNVAPRPEAEKPREQLEGAAASLRNLQQEVQTVENAVRDTVVKKVQEARTEAAQKAGAEETKAPLVFNPEERAERIETLTNRLSQDVHVAIANGDVKPEKLEGLATVLKSSLEELQLLIKDETGVDVDLSPSARAVADTVAANSPQLEKAREEVLKRKGLELYKDSDDDGISDYDERHIYGTDPENAATAGGSLTDGERVLLGFNPLSTSTERIPVESPRVAGEVAENIFEVHTIRVDLEELPGEKVADDAPPVFKEALTFAGRGLPNSFVTLYVFSTPVVVTVKADASGAWTYTLDSELEDGDHELYVATVDAGGRILAKSPVVPFVKRAQATEFAPLLVAAVHEPTPLEFLFENLWLVGVMAFLLFGIVALIILGLMRQDTTDTTPPPSGPAVV